ncbi:MAG: hypothetical protein R3F55_24510 [Alphaproteobacteria bacterium]
MLLLVALVAALSGIAATKAQPDDPVAPRADHPRLWLTADDLPRLRSWATADNPIWRDGLAPLAERMKADMDEGRVPGEDTGQRYWEAYPTESYAELFAFLSLVDPDPAARADYAARARTLLMDMIREAAKGPAAGEPYRDPEFMAPFSDRARWWGEAWPLTVDWIYPSLSADDKATIRRVFLRWADEIVTEGYNHPTPVGLINDPALVADRLALRWAGNNYFTSHMRNLGLMALALDPADDPGGELGAYAGVAAGAHLYMTDRLLRTDAAGGMAPEGFEYSPQALAYVAQFHLALRTAGVEDPARLGPQVLLDDNPFWDAVIPAHLNALSPRTTLLEGYEYWGPVYEPFWFGDGELYWAPDMIALLGPLALYDQAGGNEARLEAIRWIETHTPMGGEEMLAVDRVFYASGSSLLTAILYFMLFDPEAPAAADPRPALPTMHFAPGIGRLSVRTGWDEDASWFTYGLGWISIDHQFGDGNGFGFYRDGEWLTKGLVGYGGEYGDDDPSDDFYYPSSDQQNTLALQNDEPYSNVPGDYRSQLYLRGSQWEYVAAGDPTILALSVAPGFAYVTGDATNLYNSADEGAMDIAHASRSIAWLAPDTIVVYDRAASRTAGRFKRFWLNFPADAAVDGSRTVMTTADGQRLVVDTLLPAGAEPVVAPVDAPVDTMALGEPMRFKLMVEAPGDPSETRFLHVLQGADGGAAVSMPVALESDDGAFAGAAVGGVAVLFPVALGAPPERLRYTAPAGTTTHLVAGLAPGGGYDVAVEKGDGGVSVIVAPGTALQADAGGVLLVGSLPALIDAPPLAFSDGAVGAAPGPGAAPDSASAAVPANVTSAAPDAPRPGGLFGVPAATAGSSAAASGAGTIVFETYDEALGSRRLWRQDAAAGATAADVTLALDAAGGQAPDDWIGIAPDGEWLLLGTQRFDPECAGWPCLAVAAADLSAGEAVRTPAGVVHPEGFGAIAAGGGLVVYPAAGPHPTDLWAVARVADGPGGRWSEPVLLTGDSPYAYNHTAAISADGARVVFDCGDQPYGVEGTALCEAATDGSAFRVVLTPADAPPGYAPGGALHHPDYAPDGSIVFESRWTDGIWRLAPDTPPVPISPQFQGDAAPCVLADGRIASLWYGRPGNAGVAEIKMMTPAGAEYAMLLTDIHVEDIGCGG